MDPITALLSRHLDRIAHNSWLLAVPPTLTPFLADPAHFVTTFDVKAADQWHRQNTHLGWHIPSDPRPLVILFYPKAKREADMLLDMAISHLQLAGGRLWVVGENKGGIKSVPNLLKRRGLSASKIDSARHCALFELDLAPKPEHQLASLDHYAATLTLGNGLELVSYPGVFSAGKLDIGTRLLLEHLPTPEGPLLDFGCGCGVIGAHVLRNNPNAQVDGLDINWLAIAAASRTAQANGVSFRQLYCADGLADSLPKYRHIVSNPPFHEGVGTQYDTTEAFIAQACQHLEKGGTLTLVANHFLRYEPLIERAFGHCRELARGQGFKVLFAQRCG